MAPFLDGFGSFDQGCTKYRDLDPGAMKLHCKLGIVIVSLYSIVASQPHCLDA